MPRPSAQREPDEASEDGQTHHHPGEVVAHMARMETMQHVHRAVGRGQGAAPARPDDRRRDPRGQRNRPATKRQAQAPGRSLSVDAAGATTTSGNLYKARSVYPAESMNAAARLATEWTPGNTTMIYPPARVLPSCCRAAAILLSPFISRDLDNPNSSIARACSTCQFTWGRNRDRR